MTVPVGLAEQTEIAAYVDFVAGAPSSVRETLGISSRRIGDVQALVLREDPSGFFNRAGGFASTESVTVETLTEVCEFFRAEGLSAGGFAIAPSLLPSDWSATAAKVNLSEGTRYVKLGCEIETALAGADSDSGLRVDLVEPDQAQEFATVMMDTFGFTTPAMVDLTASCVGRTNWQQYAAWDGDEIVAVGSIFVNGDCADMFGGATVPGARGRGAQSALLAARLRGAQAAGCRWMVAETGAEAPGVHNTSLHNMQRAGFERLYDRVTWVWRAV
ncbi:GNAT family N-acetyltransferase [Kribbella sp. NPDC000426]|uniref:GNAT family N-acetyltransferase n=1 Tax=Kribbella sp. NPDC000426 TaxID=3154255 RepID=UPI00331F711A